MFPRAPPIMRREFARDAAGRDVLASPRFFRDIVTRKMGNDAQKVRRRSRPTAAFRHEYPDASCHWVRLDDALDRGFAVCIIGVRKGAGGPQRCSASSAPHGKVCHPRQAREKNTGQCLQAVRAPPANDLAVRRALEAAGVEFIEESGSVGAGCALKEASAAKGTQGISFLVRASTIFRTL